MSLTHSRYADTGLVMITNNPDPDNLMKNDGLARQRIVTEQMCTVNDVKNLYKNQLA